VPGRGLTARDPEQHYIQALQSISSNNQYNAREINMALWAFDEKNQ
jgi:hypothetical protein